MEDVVLLIKAAAVAPNTSNSLDLVEAQGSHLRETVKCLPRRLALLGHVLSLDKVACSSPHEHSRSELAATFLTWQVLPVRLLGPQGFGAGFRPLKYER